MSVEDKDKVEDQAIEENEEDFEDLFGNMFGKDKGEDEPEEDSEVEDNPTATDEAEDEDPEPEPKEEAKPKDDKPTDERRKIANLPVDQLYGVIDSIEDDTIKSQVQEIINRAERFRGSQSALTKKLQGYEQTTKELEAQIQEVNKREPNKESRRDAKAPQSLEALKAKYPQLAQAIEDTVDYQKNLGKDSLSRDEVERMVNERLAPVTKKLSDDNINDQMSRLDEMASDLLDTDNTGVKASDIILGEYSEDFKAWLGTQPESVMQMARAATDADSAFVILTMYETAYQREAAKQSKTEDKPTEQVKTKNEQPTKAEEIASRRSKKLEKGDTPSSSQRGAPSESPDSFDALFDSWFGKDGKYTNR